MNNTTQIIEKVYEYLENIIKDEGDDECQHSLEDELHTYIIQNVHLLNMEEIQTCQKICKKIEEMDFARWCA